MRRVRGRKAPSAAAPPLLSFGGWGDLSGSTLAVCHPGWRGVRTAAYAFGDPVVETAEPERDAPAIVAGARNAGVGVLIVHGFPPGAVALFQAAKRAGLQTRCVMHSSLAQHGAEAGEAEMMDAVAELAAAGTLDRIGVVKEGIAEALTAMGVTATHTPNRVPSIGMPEKIDLGSGAPHIGVFGAPYWRKNVVTQLGAVALLGGTGHVMVRPSVGYLDGMRLVEHGELPRDRFLNIQASTQLNLYVTLSECHPMGPMESYLSGVPALMSRTSGVFRSDPTLWDLTTTDRPDDPTAIAAAARRLTEHGADAIARAKEWMRRADADAATIWQAFVGGAR